MQILARSLDELEIASPRTFAGLTVFPLLAREVDRGERPYRTLDQALDDGSARVTEMGEEGRVPELRFVNDGSRPVLLLDGEEIVGAKQNRILNLSILAPAKTSIVIPVSCVEAGRWSSVSARFAPERHVMHSRGRRKKTARVSHAMAHAGQPRSNQGEIWSDVAELSVRHGVRSRTSEMRAVFHRRSRDLDEYVAAFPTIDRQVGVLFALGDQVRGLEIFDRGSTLSELLPKIIRSWALDAIELGPRAHRLPTTESAKAFLLEAQRARHTEHDAIGLGRDVRLDGQRLAGGALVHEGRVVHLCAFRLDEGEGQDSGHRSVRARIARASRRGRRDPAA